MSKRNPPIHEPMYIPIGETTGFLPGSNVHLSPWNLPTTRLDPETLEPMHKSYQAPGYKEGTIFYSKGQLKEAGGWIGPGTKKHGAFRSEKDSPWHRHARILAKAKAKAKSDLKKMAITGVYIGAESPVPVSGGKGIGKLSLPSEYGVDVEGIDTSDYHDWQRTYKHALSQDQGYRAAMAEYRALSPEEKRGRGRPKGTKDYIKRQRRTKAEMAAGVSKHYVPESEKFKIWEEEGVEEARAKFARQRAIDQKARERATLGNEWQRKSALEKLEAADYADNLSYFALYGKKKPGKMRSHPDRNYPDIKGELQVLPAENEVEKGVWGTRALYADTSEAPGIVDDMPRRGRGRPPGSKNKARAVAPIIQLAAPQYRKRGRPPGSKNKPKEGTGMVLSMQPVIKRGRGRPPGSKNKPKYASNPYNDGDYMAAVRMNPRKPSKYVETYVIQGNYGQGWEDVSASSIHKEARALLKDYDDNEPNAHRLITRRSLRTSNPRVKGAKDTYKRVRRTAGELMASGIEDSADGMPPMSKNKHYMKGYKQAKTHPKLRGATRPDVARAAAIETTRSVSPRTGMVGHDFPPILPVSKRSKKEQKLALEAQQDFYRYNPIRHITKRGQGRPTTAWWILDLYSARGKKISTIIGQGSKAKSTSEAKSFINKSYRGYSVAKVELSGPYSRQPTSKTVRK